jgi:hypothetical protein
LPKTLFWWECNVPKIDGNLEAFPSLMCWFEGPLGFLQCLIMNAILCKTLWLGLSHLWLTMCYIIWHINPITRLCSFAPNSSVYKTTPTPSHNQTWKISLDLGLTYWTWFLLVFVFNSMPITKLFFVHSKLGVKWAHVTPITKH